MGTLINTCDEKLFECVAKEVIRLAGTTGYVFQLIKDSSTRDSYYDETISTEYKKDTDGKYGILTPLQFKAPSKTGITGEEGYRLERNSEVWIAKADLDSRGLTKPIPGDIIMAWDMYWDVVIWSKENAYVNDTPDSYAEVQVDVVRRTEAPPEALWIRGKTR